MLSNVTMYEKTCHSWNNIEVKKILKRQLGIEQPNSKTVDE